MRMGVGMLRRRRGGGGGKPPENTIKTAIKQRHHIRAVRDGVNVLIQPYALLKVTGSSVLHGVVVSVEGEASGAWAPTDIEVPTLSEIEIYDETFVPSDAFSADGLSGVVSVVKIIDPFEDPGEEVTGAD